MSIFLTLVNSKRVENKFHSSSKKLQLRLLKNLSEITKNTKIVRESQITIDYHIANYEMWWNDEYHSLHFGPNILFGVDDYFFITLMLRFLEKTGHAVQHNGMTLDYPSHLLHDNLEHFLQVDFTVGCMNFVDLLTRFVGHWHHFLTHVTSQSLNQLKRDQTINNF